MADTLRVLLDGDLSPIYYDMTQVTTAVCIRLRTLVLFFFVMNLEVLGNKVMATSYQEMQLRLQKVSRRWRAMIAMFVAGEVAVLVLIVAR